MNRVKHLAVLFLVIGMMFGMCVPVYATTLELLPPKSKAFDGNICTVKYYTPDDTYTQVLIVGTRTNAAGNPNKYHLVYLKPEQKFDYGGNTKCYMSTEKFYYLTFATYEEAIECLFNCSSALDYTASPDYQYSGYSYCLHGGFSYPIIYLYQETRFSAEAAASIEAAYYDWYVETYGEEPEFEKIDTGNGESTDNSGIVSKLEEFIETFKQSLNPDVSFLDSVQLTILENLEENSMYNSLLYITKTLQSLFTEDYTKYSSYKENTVLKITAHNLAISNNDGSYNTSKIDWGLDNTQILDLKWYFGNHPYANENYGYFVNVDGSYAVKHYSDTVISGFLWLVFGWYVFHNLPDLISGEIGQVTAVTRGVGAKNQAEAQAEQRKKEKEYNESYDAYKKKKDRENSYKERYDKEKGGKK